MTILEKKCPVCGKLFIARDDWAFKRPDKYRTQRFICSWSCLKKYDEKHQTKEKRRHFVRRTEL